MSAPQPPPPTPLAPPSKPRPKQRVVYRVERLPEPLRALVDRGLARGKSYRQIQQEVADAGESISTTAICHYWRNRWQHQQERIAWVHAYADRLAQMLRQTGESDEAVLARKLLLAHALTRMEEALQKMEFPDLLRETREMVKATRNLKSHSPAAPPLTPAERRRRVREIYGWPQEELDAREKQD